MPSKTDGKLHRRTERTTQVNPQVDEIIEEHGDWYRAQRGETFIVTLITEQYEVWYAVKNGVREESGHNYSITLGGPVITAKGKVHSSQWSSQTYGDLAGRRLDRLPEVVRNDYVAGKELMSQ